MHRTGYVWIILLLLGGCALGPTPERIGFDYPEAGIKFNPRRNVVSDSVRGNISLQENASYTLLFPRTTSQIESPYTRLLTTGIEGEWNDNQRPLYDELSERLFEAESPYEFRLIEERDIDLPWSGLLIPSGTYRTFEMTPVEGEGTMYTFTVVVHHFENTIEFCWRDSSETPPDEQKIEKFFYWTHGMRFYEPVEENSVSDEM